MKKNLRVRTSVTLPKELLAVVDKLAGEHRSRSELIENLLRAYVAEVRRRQSNARDLKIINRNADRLNREALETLEYQREL